MGLEGQITNLSSIYIYIYISQLQTKCSCGHVKMLNIALSPRAGNVQGFARWHFTGPAGTDDDGDGWGGIEAAMEQASP